MCRGIFFGRYYVTEVKIMPNAKVLSEKQAIVAELKERIKSSGSGVFVDYKGITVLEDTALRSELRKNDVEYSVIKNTLCRRAIDELGLSEIDPILNGTTSLATSTGDPIAPFRIVSEFAKKMGADKFNVKAGYMDGKVMKVDDLVEIAKLPGREGREGLVGWAMGDAHRRSSSRPRRCDRASRSRDFTVPSGMARRRATS